MSIREVDLGNVRGDINDSEATFSQAATRENINSGEKGKTIFGKIKKWFSDMGNAAFCLVVNNATTTVANTVLDGRMGKTLMDKIAELNRNNGYRTEFKLIEKSSNYVLPKFTHMCTVYAQVEGLTSMQSIIGSQESASSVIGAKIGTNQYVNIQKNSVNNAYVSNTNTGTGARLMVMYI